MNVKSTPRANPRAAFTMIELLVAMSILTVAIFATLAALAESAQLRQGSAETETATQRIQARLAELRSTSLDMTDLASAEGAFSVVGEARLKNLAGLVEVLTEADASATFRCDLDKNGVIDGNDLYDLDNDGIPGEGVASDPADTTTGSKKDAYTRLVPVRVSLTWESITGSPRRLSVESFIYPSGG
jgi:type II secretory pathway component PulJ